MPQISAVIITLNEERNIERCLQSVIDVVDEVVVVDSYSTDRTEEICKKYNVRFIKHQFEGYIEQKNWATEQATYDYVLSLDADEALSVELKESIKKVKQNWDADGYTFNRLTNYCGKWIRHTSWYPSRKLRLWDRRKGQWDGLNPHDKFIMVKGAKVKHLKGDLLHFSFYSISQQIQQINKFTDILASSYYHRGFVPNFFWHLLFHPIWRFFRDYFIKLGFLDGLYGFVVSINGGYEVFLKYLKLKKIIDTEKERNPYRICYFNSSENNYAEELSLIDNLNYLKQHHIESFVFINKYSALHQYAKKHKVNFVAKCINWNLKFNPFYPIYIYKILKLLRVRAVIVNHINDAHIIRRCKKYFKELELIYYLNNNTQIEESRKNRNLFCQHVNKILVPINYSNQLNGFFPRNKIEQLTNNFIDYQNIKKINKIAILLDKLHNPYCGLGRVSIDYSKALVEYSNIHNHLHFNYVVYGKNNIEHLNQQTTEKLGILHRILPKKIGNVDIIHKIHQTPSFELRKADKVILTIHDLNFLFTKSMYKSKRYLQKVQKNVDKADAVVFISHFTKEICFKNLIIPNDKICRVIYNGVDIPDCQEKQPAFIQTNEKFLFTIGQCLQKKNFHVLIPFVNLLPQDIKLIIAGENNTTYGSYIKKQISQFKLEDRVIMPGPISESEKKYLYKHCMAFVFPSIAEGFGLPVIEAMLYEKPVFCSDKTSLKEIGDGHAYFWTSFEPEKMIEVFRFGMNDFDDTKKKKALDYARQFSWERNAEEYYKLYNELLEQH